ncbi:MAG: hypothetical protein HN742_26090 [Lentisphaerae bacterium]|jgi:rubrerythrin|nr:hypothetical protein [Lentisphaerota bacterium]MBT4816162.1 hypothetical protein [Lentisphaerota bacterium]MBT5605565.1 hypothetical protein [Lentisphaerota bacterium]MBT7056842.1 hypothetical protein [Lentisphaerota bacterium]MBT7845372.1 hypothetical protein [Lentisphaerota bacterium]
MTSSDGSAYLTCAEFVQIAIVFEQESAEFFRRLQGVTSGSARQLAALLEKQEVAHENALRKLDVAGIRDMIQFAPEKPVTIPGLPDGDLPLSDLIELGIERERAAKNTYQNAARFASGAFKNLLEGLVRFEEEHEQKLISMRGM